MKEDIRWVNRFLIKSNRWVFIQSKNSKKEGKAAVGLLKKYWTPPKYFYHLKKGGHVRALSIHKDNFVFTKFDIDNFFGSITRSRITRVLKDFIGYNNAWKIAKFSTVKNPETTKDPTSDLLKFMLPFGFIQSPLLASICLDKSYLGDFLRKIYSDPRLTLSVYVDDIIISAKDEKLLQTTSNNLRDAIIKSHWISNSQKEVICRNKIIAYNIEVANSSMEINEDRMKKFMESFKVSTNSDQKNGILRYIVSVNPLQRLNF